MYRSGRDRRAGIARDNAGRLAALSLLPSGTSGNGVASGASACPGADRPHLAPLPLRQLMTRPAAPPGFLIPDTRQRAALSARLAPTARPHVRDDRNDRPGAVTVVVRQSPCSHTATIPAAPARRLSVAAS